ncbi:MAG: autotransporter outer membrane beta-barrel domain-containing protein [Rickettsiaceae bacterium]|nr:autotransporter outer membrane beta-barrel domain-containing protein [Rickettsiaceae bacterium]
MNHKYIFKLIAISTSLSTLTLFSLDAIANSRSATPNPPQPSGDQAASMNEGQTIWEGVFGAQKPNPTSTPQLPNKQKGKHGSTPPKNSFVSSQTEVSKGFGGEDIDREDVLHNPLQLERVRNGIMLLNQEIQYKQNKADRRAKRAAMEGEQATIDAAKNVTGKPIQETHVIAGANNPESAKPAMKNLRPMPTITGELQKQGGKFISDVSKISTEPEAPSAQGARLHAQTKDEAGRLINDLSTLKTQKNMQSIPDTSDNSLPLGIERYPEIGTDYGSEDEQPFEVPKHTPDNPTLAKTSEPIQPETQAQVDNDSGMIIGDEGPHVAPAHNEEYNYGPLDHLDKIKSSPHGILARIIERGNIGGEEGKAIARKLKVRAVLDAVDKNNEEDKKREVGGDDNLSKNSASTQIAQKVNGGSSVSSETSSISNPETGATDKEDDSRKKSKLGDGEELAKSHETGKESDTGSHKRDTSKPDELLLTLDEKKKDSDVNDSIGGSGDGGGSTPPDEKLAFDEEDDERKRASLRNSVSSLHMNSLLLSKSIVDSVQNDINIRLSTLAVNQFGLASGDESYGVRGIWVSGIFGNGALSKSTYSKGLKSEFMGGSAGIDFEINDSNLIGASFAYASGNAKSKDFQKLKTNTRNYIFSLYTQSKLTENIVLNNTISAGFGKYQTKRPEGENVFKGKTNTDSMKIQTNLGYLLPISAENNVFFIPSIGFKYESYKIGSYKETGSKSGEGFSIGKASTNGFSGILAASLASAQNFSEGMKAVPSLNFSVEKRFSGNKGNVVKIIDDGSTYPLKGGNQAKYLAYNAGASVALSGADLELVAGYNFHKQNKYQSHQGNVKLRILF